MQDKPVKNTSCHPLFVLFVHSPPVLLCCSSYSQTRLPSIKACLFTKAPSSPWSHLIALLTLVYCARTHSFETVYQWNGSSIALQRSRHLAVSIVTLLSAPSPCCRLSHSLAVGLVALQSVSSPCCQPPRLAVGRLEICLTALQSAPSPCSRPRHLAVGPIALQLLILSLITRHRNKTSQVCHWFSTLSTYFRFEELAPDVTDTPS